MKLEIEVPEIACCRCSKIAAVYPTALKRTSGDSPITDSAGNHWQALGALMPSGWTQAPSDANKHLCDICTAAVNVGLSRLLEPPAPPPPLPPPGMGQGIPLLHKPTMVQPNHIVPNTIAPGTRISTQPTAPMVSPTSSSGVRVSGNIATAAPQQSTKVSATPPQQIIRPSTIVSAAAPAASSSKVASVTKAAPPVTMAKTAFEMKPSAPAAPIKVEQNRVVPIAASPSSVPAPNSSQRITVAPTDEKNSGRIPSVVGVEQHGAPKNNSRVVAVVPNEEFVAGLEHVKDVG